MDQPRRTQRLGAYAVVLREQGTQILLARVSATGYPAGWWALPGGGVDHGESPHDAVARELYEEAGLKIARRRLVDVHHVHTVAPGRADQWEDYHGVHLLYAVDVEPGEARVIEVGGTTDVVAWWPVDEPPSPLLPAVEHVLAHLDDYRPTSPSA